MPTVQSKLTDQAKADGLRQLLKLNMIREVINFDESRLIVFVDGRKERYSRCALKAESGWSLTL